LRFTMELFVCKWLLLVLIINTNCYYQSDTPVGAVALVCIEVQNLCSLHLT